MKTKIYFWVFLFLLSFSCLSYGQLAHNLPEKITLYEMRWRDNCIYPDRKSGYYYMVGPAGNSVVCYRSEDLIHWTNPIKIFTVPKGFWGDIDIKSIWAPELHFYQEKYYLFLTFDTNNKLCEQWRNWLPRVTRGSQILVSDSICGPYKPFQNHSTLPVDMMTLDGTLWIEDGVPYMVFCHEWVQITNGSICCIRLKNDLSETIGEPIKLFHGSEAEWSVTGKQHGNNVTDGCFLYRGKTGKLYLLWASGGKYGYTQGVSISESGKLIGPWSHQKDPLYSNDGGHAMVFTTFDGRLMMVLHSPNNRDSRPHIFEMEDTGNTLQIINELQINLF